MSGILVVAQCPKPGPAPRRALEGSASLRRLCSLGGCDEEAFYERVDVVNLLPGYPGPRWPAAEAARSAVALRADAGADGGRRVVLLGAAVRAAFVATWADVPEGWFRWSSGGYSVSPHPSGLSRAWNDPTVATDGRAFWGALLATERTRR